MYSDYLDNNACKWHPHAADLQMMINYNSELCTGDKKT